MLTSETRTLLLITGMRDTASRQAVAEALEAVAGVTAVDVNLFRARATVRHGQSVREADLFRAVAQAGCAATAATAKWK